MNSVPYLDFYRRHDVSPVAQDIRDMDAHFQRRDSLYRFLGIPPAFVEGRRVAEFGPGSGHNALFTASLKPSRYVLVDGNPRGVAETRALLRTHFGNGQAVDVPGIEVIESTFEAFDTEERFDLVLAEGFLPHVIDPQDLLRRLARFVRPGGILVITTVSPVSIVSENIRRLIRTGLVAPKAPPKEQIAAVLPVLGPHLDNLRGMSRSHEDWIIDNIVQPVADAGLLSIPQAIAALDDSFDAYGSSPALYTDLRWYKDARGADRGFNQRFIHCCNRRIAALLDWRFEPDEHDASVGQGIEADARALWDCMNGIEVAGEVASAAAAGPILESLADRVGPFLPRTSAALAEAAACLSGRITAAEMREFPSFWGRGQQYLSLIRRAGT